jgi:hypothetical protein
MLKIHHVLHYIRLCIPGVRIKSALIAAVFKKSLSVDMTACTESTGRLTNLVSVDVSEIQNFVCYSHFVWSTVLEICLAVALLLVVLGRAAVAGIATMLAFIYIGAKLGSK